ncbi:MAG: hypothetical protein KGL19_08590, partial [Bacteroidota bacterium]|nr:hypothetical protein [Bacteroidota bacterium]
GMKLEGDHYDVLQKKNANNRCVICGHIDEDSLGCKEWDNGPFYPMGSVQGKVTTAALAKDMKFWARMGHPCGQDFIGEKFYKLHPEYKWQEKYLKDMKSYPWTLFEAKK